MCAPSISLRKWGVGCQLSGLWCACLMFAVHYLYSLCKVVVRVPLKFSAFLRYPLVAFLPLLLHHPQFQTLPLPVLAPFHLYPVYIPHSLSSRLLPLKFPLYRLHCAVLIHFPSYACSRAKLSLSGVSVQGCGWHCYCLQDDIEHMPVTWDVWAGRLQHGYLQMGKN